jgi:hypothetical protein
VLGSEAADAAGRESEVAAHCFAVPANDDPSRQLPVSYIALDTPASVDCVRLAAVEVFDGDLPGVHVRLVVPHEIDTPGCRLAVLAAVGPERPVTVIPVDPPKDRPFTCQGGIGHSATAIKRAPLRVRGCVDQAVARLDHRSRIARFRRPSLAQSADGDWTSDFLTRPRSGRRHSRETTQRLADRTVSAGVGSGCRPCRPGRPPKLSGGVRAE